MPTTLETHAAAGSLPASDPSVVPNDDATRSPARRSLLTRLAVVVLLLAGAALVIFAMLRSPAGDETIPIDGSSAAAIEAEGAVRADPIAATDTATAATGTVTLVDVSDLVDDLVGSVVRIDVTSRITSRFRTTMVDGSGSGIILTGDGTIVTNAHVVDSADSIAVVLADGTEYVATLVGIDADADVAVISIDAAGLPAIDAGSTDLLEVGDPLVAIGYPLGLDGAPTVTTGVVSALDRHLESSDQSLAGVIQTDAAITEGSSGGALVDADGRLVGMTTAVGVSSVGVEGIGFSLPVETVLDVVARLTA